MTYSDLLYQLKLWEKHNPELLENPAIFSSEDEEPIEIDAINEIPSELAPNQIIETRTALVLTP